MHQMCVNPQLKIVPKKKKKSLFAPVWVTFAKNYSAQLF